MTDRDFDQIIGRLLQIGVTTAAAVVFSGGIWLMTANGDRRPAYATFHGEPDQLRFAGRLTRSLLHPTPAVVIQFGLLLLIATPVARVAFSLGAFAFQRDWTYTVITLIVLAVLAYSLTPHG